MDQCNMFLHVHILQALCQLKYRMNARVSRVPGVPDWYSHVPMCVTCSILVHFPVLFLYDRSG